MGFAPLLIIMGTILGLLGIQGLLARASAEQNSTTIQRTSAGTEKSAAPNPATPQSTTAAESKTSSTPQKARGKKLAEGLSVTGLDERGMSSLKALIHKQDRAALATFLAFNRPGFVEIDAYLEDHRRHRDDQSAIPAELQPRIDKLLNELTDSERKLVQEFNPKSARLISRDLMSRFGGHEFSTYFGHYSARPQSITLHVPPFDPDRKILEDLTQSGIAKKGRHIPLNTRLTVLKMSQLRQMAKDLNLDKKFTRKQEAADTLADIPGAAVLLSMQYVIDDLFMLQPIKEDIVLIKHEWSLLEAYAKMLSTLTL